MIANRGKTIILFLIFMLCVSVANANQTNDSDKYTFDRYGGEKFTPQPMEFGENLQNKGQDGLGISSSTKANETERKHMLLQFYANPNEEQQEMLKERGVNFVHGAGTYSFVVSMPASLTPADLPAEAGLRWMGEIPVENKYDHIFGLNAPEWARTEDGQIELWIVFYEDVTYEEAQKIANKYSSTAPAFEMYPYMLDCLITTNEGNITAIASEDIVQRAGFPSDEPFTENESPTEIQKSPGFQFILTVLVLLFVLLYLKKEGFK